jgi:hypothetical protein
MTREGRDSTGATSTNPREQWARFLDAARDVLNEQPSKRLVGTVAARMARDITLAAQEIAEGLPC